MNLKTIAMISKVRHGVSFIEALAKVFPSDSRANRAISALTSVMLGIDSITQLAIEVERSKWQKHVNSVIRDAIERYGVEIMSSADVHRKPINMWQLGDHVVFWDDQPEFWSMSSIEDIAAAVLAAVLADLGPDSRVAVTSTGLSSDVEVAPLVMTSQIQSLTESTRLEMTRGNRSILIYGPPGAGKSAASRQMADQLSGTTMVVTSDMLTSISDVDVFSLICMWKPGAVIFDDIDRVLCDNGPIGSGGGWLLSGITRVRAAVPLVIATANTRDGFAGAILRPGRFDRITHMTRLDDAIILHELAALPVEIRDRAIASGLLGSYVDELAIRFACGGDPIADFDELLERQIDAGDGFKPVGEHVDRAT